MGDPVDDFLRHDARKERKLKEKPVCVICGEYIQTERAVNISGQWICDDCIMRSRKWVEE